jgi:hypothetical protein
MDVTAENARALLANFKANLENMQVDLDQVKMEIGAAITSGMSPHEVDQALVKLDRISATLAAMIQYVSAEDEIPEVEELT